MLFADEMYFDESGTYERIAPVQEHHEMPPDYHFDTYLRDFLAHAYGTQFQEGDILLTNGEEILLDSQTEQMDDTERSKDTWKEASLDSLISWSAESLDVGDTLLRDYRSSSGKPFLSSAVVNQQLPIGYQVEVYNDASFKVTATALSDLTVTNGRLDLGAVGTGLEVNNQLLCLASPLAHCEIMLDEALNAAHSESSQFTVIQRDEEALNPYTGCGMNTHLFLETNAETLVIPSGTVLYIASSQNFGEIAGNVWNAVRSESDVAVLAENVDKSADANIFKPAESIRFDGESTLIREYYNEPYLFSDKTGTSVKAVRTVETYAPAATGNLFDYDYEYLTDAETGYLLRDRQLCGGDYFIFAGGNAYDVYGLRLNTLGIVRALPENAVTDEIAAINALTAPVLTSSDETEKPSHRLGDANGDGEVDIIDVIAVNKYLLATADLSSEGKNAVDFDQNGVDAADSLNLLKYVVELITEEALQALTA